LKTRPKDGRRKRPTAKTWIFSLKIESLDFLRACSLAMSAHARAIAAKLIGAPLTPPGVIGVNAGAGEVCAGPQVLALRTAEIAHR
jgi:hypothetical protein